MECNFFKATRGVCYSSSVKLMRKMWTWRSTNTSFPGHFFNTWWEGDVALIYFYWKGDYVAQRGLSNPKLDKRQL